MTLCADTKAEGMTPYATIHTESIISQAVSRLSTRLRPTVRYSGSHLLLSRVDAGTVRNVEKVR